MRRVMVSEYKKQLDGKFKLEEKGEANFHCFGLDFQEFENGASSFSTAIIEWPDGTVGNVPADNIRFL